MMMQALDVVYRHELPDQMTQMRAELKRVNLHLERTCMGKEDTRSKMVEIACAAYQSEASIRADGTMGYFKYWLSQLTGMHKLLCYLLRDGQSRYWVTFG